jgi:hypothetical protein
MGSRIAAARFSSGSFAVGVFMLLLLLAPLAFAGADTASAITFDGVTPDRSAGIADGVFADGWKWEFHFTVPSSETLFKMQFDDSTSSSNYIPAGGNIRFYSPQSSDASTTDSAILITASSTLAGPMTLVGDENGDTPDRQIDIVVEVKIPTGTPGGNYSTSYSIDTEAPPDTTPPVITLNGDATISLNVGDTYTESGATAADDVDGTDVVIVGGDAVDPNTPGTYIVTYDAVDAAGNHAVQVARTVMVTAACLYPQPSFIQSGDNTGHLQASPQIVPTGLPTTLFWNVADVASCTVSGTDNENWTGLSSGPDGQATAPILEQTVFTLTCEALPGVTPSSLSETATVDVLPVFEER